MADSSPPPTALSGAARLRERKRRPRATPWRIKNAWLILAIVAVFLVGMILSGSAQKLLARIYGPATVLIVVVLIVEYILLKGRDRSRIYKIELESLREKRDREIEFLRRLEGELEELDAALQASAEGSQSEKARRLRERLDALRSDLAQHL